MYNDPQYKQLEPIESNTEHTFSPNGHPLVRYTPDKHVDLLTIERREDSTDFFIIRSGRKGGVHAVDPEIVKELMARMDYLTMVDGVINPRVAQNVAAIFGCEVDFYSMKLLKRRWMDALSVKTFAA